MAKFLKSLSPQERIQLAYLLGGIVLLLFLATLAGFLSVRRSMQKVDQYNRAIQLARETDTNFQLAISKGKNFAILKDGLNKSREQTYFQKAQKSFLELSALETDPQGRELIYKLGAGIKNVEFPLGILTSTAKKNDSAEKLYTRVLKDITIDFDNASQAYVDYLGGKINRAQIELNSRINLDLFLGLLGVLLALAAMVTSFSIARNLKQSLQNETASQERYHLLADVAEEAIMIHDQGIIKDANPALARLLGYEMSEIIGKNVSQFQDVTATQRTQQHLQKGYPEGSYEIQALRKDGTTFPLLVHGRDIEYQGRKMRLSCGWDMTEWKKAEIALQESEERFRRFAQVTKEGIFIHDDGVIVDANQALADMTGYSIREMIGQKDMFLGTAEGREKLEKFRKEGFPEIPYETIFVRKDGSLFPAENHGRSFTFEGKLLRVVSIWDITERKKVEEDLRLSEENFRNLIESAPDAILVNREGKIAYVNKRCVELLGYADKEELFRLAPMDVVHPDDREAVIKRIQNALRGEANPLAEIRILKKDGSSTDMETTSIGIQFQGRSATMVILRDIADRKKAEEALRNSEEKFRSLIENSHDIISIANKGGVVTYMSPSVKRILGHDPSELVGQRFAPIMHPDDIDRMRAVFAEFLKTKGTTVIAEFRLKHKDGSWRDIESVGINLLESQPVNGIIYNMRDITEKKQAERALRGSEERFRNMLENSNEGITLTAADSTALYISPSNKRLTGYEPEERLGRSVLEMVHPDDLANAREILEKLRQSPGMTITTQVRIRHKNGEWRDGEVTATNLIDNPDVGGILINSRDVTEKMKAEQALRDSEEKFRSLIENAQDVVYILDHQWKRIYESPSLERVLGYKPGEREGTSVWDYIHLDDHEKVRKAFDAALRMPGVAQQTELRAKHKAGGWRNVETSITNLLEDTAIRGWVINFWDVTKRKKAEEALRQSEENFRNLIEKSPDAMIVHTLEKTVYVNDAMLKLLGYRQTEELVGRNPEIIVHPDDREVVNTRIRRLKPGEGFNPPAERKFLTKDGQIVPVEVVSFTIQFQGQPMVVAIARDLTERKEAERALMKFERLSTIGEMAAGMAHEIRNPLAAISTAAQLLKRQEKKKEGALFADTILEQSQRLNRLVEDTLDYARAEKPIPRESFNLQPLLESALHLSQVQFGPSHTKVQVQWDLPKRSPALYANPQRVQQILVNLILNAYQIMGEGGTLTIGFKTDGPSALIRVADTGPGIREEDVNRVFEPFYTTKKGGSGLGLALSQRIAQEYGGKISVERLEPHGTAFTLQLPIGE